MPIVNKFHLKSPWQTFFQTRFKSLLKIIGRLKSRSYVKSRSWLQSKNWSKNRSLLRSKDSLKNKSSPRSKSSLRSRSKLNLKSLPNCQLTPLKINCWTIKMRSSKDKRNSTTMSFSISPPMLIKRPQKERRCSWPRLRGLRATITRSLQTLNQKSICSRTMRERSSLTCLCTRCWRMLTRQTIWRCTLPSQLSKSKTLPFSTFRNAKLT